MGDVRGGGMEEVGGHKGGLYCIMKKHIENHHIKWRHSQTTGY